LAKKLRAKLTEEQLKEIEALGYHDATMDDIVDMMGYSKTWLNQLSKDSGGSVQLAKRRGKLKAKLAANKKLNELVQKGDITAVQFFLKREERRDERRQDAENPGTTIHVAQNSISENAPKVVISIPSNGREITEV
jgi:hypothetical protein